MPPGTNNGDGVLTRPAKFTDGPWIVHPMVARVDCQKLSEKGGLLPVCQMLWPTDERSEDETEANAHLIASAPDLYEALQQIVSMQPRTDVQRHWFAKGAEALAKARGEQVQS